MALNQGIALYEQFDRAVIGGVLQGAVEMADLLTSASNGAVVVTEGLVEGDVAQDVATDRLATPFSAVNTHADEAATFEAMKQFERSIVGQAYYNANTIPRSLIRYQGQDLARITGDRITQLNGFALETKVNSALAMLKGVSKVTGLAGLKLDKSGETGDLSKLTMGYLDEAKFKLGAHYGDVRCWVMSSKPYSDLISGTGTNSSRLFDYSNYQISTFHGAPILVIDSAQLTDTGSKYLVYGLREGALQILNGIFDQSTQVAPNDKKMIYTSIVSNLQYGCGVKNIKWGSSISATPALTALATASNYALGPANPKVETDFYGVQLIVK